MRTNYVLVDFENVQPSSLEQLVAQEHFKLFVFVGAHQTRLPFEMADSVQRLGPRAMYVKMSGHGPNALDFHIAYYIGQLAASDPTGYFHIISKDTGFDPLIQHLRSRSILAGRAQALTEILSPKTSNSSGPFEVALKRLQQHKATRPASLKTLTSTIASLFQKQLSEEEISGIVQTLVKKGYVVVAGTKISYNLPRAG